MMTLSNNEATNHLLDNYLERATAVQYIFDSLGMSNSTFNSQWGISTTTAEDQVLLLKNIYMESDLLSEPQQAYIQKLMYSVDETQAWGVGAGSSQVGLKNGWLIGDYSANLTSIGQVTNGEKKYLIAVLTDNNEDMETGVRVIEGLTRITSDILFQQ